MNKKESEYNRTLEEEIEIQPNFLPSDLYDNIYRHLCKDFHIVNEQPILKCRDTINPYMIYHPSINRGRQRRSLGFMSNVSEGYRYSGQIIYSQPITFEIQLVIDIVNQYLGTKFNGVLINYYESGEEYISAHSDDERGLDKKSNEVASISFGSSRIFRIRDKKTKNIVHDFQLINNMLFVMKHDFQKKYTHEIPKQKNTEGRISLTFRSHISIATEGGLWS